MRKSILFSVLFVLSLSFSLAQSHHANEPGQSTSEQGEIRDKEYWEKLIQEYLNESNDEVIEKEKNVKTLEDYAIKEEKSAPASYESPFLEESNKAWEGYKNSLQKTCPACGGTGKAYSSQQVTNTTTTYSEDDANYYKQTNTSTSEYYNVSKCSRCGGSGKLSGN